MAIIGNGHIEVWDRDGEEPRKVPCTVELTEGGAIIATPLEPVSGRYIRFHLLSPAVLPPAT